MQKAIFRLDPLGDQTFSGYTDGRLWNGWAVPSFLKEEAERLVDAWHDLGYEADYDESTDVFRFAPIDETGNPEPNLADEEDAEHFPAIMFSGIKLYPVGAGFWVWEKVQMS